LIEAVKYSNDNAKKKIHLGERLSFSRCSVKYYWSLTMLVLEQPLVFGFVLQYAEPDQWLFFGLVSKAWTALYSVVQHEHSTCRQRSTIASAAGTKTTSYAAAAASLDRALYVCDGDAALMTEKLLPLSKGAAFVGSRDVLEWAKATAGNKWCSWHHELCMSAAAGNQLAILQELRHANPEQRWDAEEVAAKAAQCADLSMLQWILEQQPERIARSITAVSAGAAGAADAIDKLAWLCQQFPADSRGLRFYFAEAAVKRGSVALLQWLVFEGYRFDQLCYATTASAAGQLAALRYLVEEANSPWDVAAVRKAAAKIGSIEIMQWASSADEAVWTTAQLSELLPLAAVHDHQRAAEWLRAVGAEWPTSFLCEGPVYHGVNVWSVHTMKWARANGCPWGAWSSTTCTTICFLSWFGFGFERQAIQDAMLWAHSAGCPCSCWRHRFAARLVRKSRSSSSSSGSDSSSSRSRSSSCGDDSVSRWNAELFRLFFSETLLLNLECCGSGMVED
jgi:hypothetical protein